MKIIVAPDSFKESMDALQACAAMAKGIATVFPDAQVIQVPMADGGEGTTEALVAGLSGEFCTVTTVDSQGEPCEAKIGIAGDRAIVEVAEAVGIEKVPKGQRNVWKASSAGVAPLLEAACAQSNEVVIGLGGSATNDGGAGMLTSLGARLLDERGNLVPARLYNLADVREIDLSPIRLPATATLQLACDVTNPLLGSTGASAVFGPQKGLAPEYLSEAEDAIDAYATALEKAVGKRLRDRPGAGAAGGLGFTLMALGATMRSGVEVVSEILNLPKVVEGATLVLTGEGSMDSQTICGKTPMGVAAIASAAGVPVVGFAGHLGPGYEELLGQGFSALVPIQRNVSTLNEALINGAENLEAAVALTMRLMQLGKTLKNGYPL